MEQFPNFHYWFGGVYVASGQLGQGVGRALVERAIVAAEASGIDTLYLQTEDLSGGLYQQLGWGSLLCTPSLGTTVLVMKQQLRPNNSLQRAVLPAAELRRWAKEARMG